MASEFNLVIILNIGIDPETGLPFVYYENNGILDKKPYIPSEFRVPKEHCRFLRQRGNHLKSYIKSFDKKCTQTAIDEFLMVFPTWNEIKNDNNFSKDNWSKFDHDDFKKAIEWFASHWCSFGVRFDY